MPLTDPPPVTAPPAPSVEAVVVASRRLPPVPDLAGLPRIARLTGPARPPEARS